MVSEGTALLNFSDVVEFVTSDPEEMNSGRFFEHINYETKRAEKERKLLLSLGKSKRIAGSIFFD